MTPRQYVGLRISNDAEAVPTVNDIDEGELAINLASERIYVRFGDVIRDITDRYTRAEIDAALSEKAALEHRHTWAQIDEKPAQAVRWPSFDEVSDKPSSYPPSAHSHTWGEVEGKPATATRWPSFEEVTGRPSSYPPSNHRHPWGDIDEKPISYPPSDHTHTLRDITDAGSAAAAERGEFDAQGSAQRAVKEARQYVDSRPDPLLMHFL